MKSRNFTKKNRDIIVIAHNIRSINNVASILRTAECLGIKKVIATGYTPNLEIATDGSNKPLLPHVKNKIADKFNRISLGAEKIVDFSYTENINQKLESLKKDGYVVVGLEQTNQSIPLPDYTPPPKLVLLLGEEVHGLTSELIKLCQDLIEIPMYGQKESFNVSVATGIALYNLIIH